MDVMPSIEQLARTIAAHQDGRTPNGYYVCLDQWRIAEALGYDWWAVTAAVKAARAELDGGA